MACVAKTALNAATIVVFVVVVVVFVVVFVAVAAACSSSSRSYMSSSRSNMSMRPGNVRTYVRVLLSTCVVHTVAIHNCT